MKERKDQRTSLLRAPSLAGPIRAAVGLGGANCVRRFAAALVLALYASCFPPPLVLVPLGARRNHATNLTDL